MDGDDIDIDALLEEKVAEPNDTAKDANETKATDEVKTAEEPVKEEKKAETATVAETTEKKKDKKAEAKKAPAFTKKKKDVKKVVKKEVVIPKKSVSELVLEPKKGSTEIKEVIKESPPPAEKVIAPKAAVKNLFLSFKRKSLKKRIKKRMQIKKKKKAKSKKKKAEIEVVKDEPKELEMETKKISREGDVGLDFNDPVMVPDAIKSSKGKDGRRRLYI